MRVTKTEIEKSLRELGENNYFIEQQGDSVIVWLYQENEFKKLQKLPFHFRKLKYGGEFPTRFVVGDDDMEKRHERREKFSQPACINLSKRVGKTKVIPGDTDSASAPPATNSHR